MGLGAAAAKQSPGRAGANLSKPIGSHQTALRPGRCRPSRARLALARRTAREVLAAGPSLPIEEPGKYDPVTGHCNAIAIVGKRKTCIPTILRSPAAARENCRG